MGEVFKASATQGFPSGTQFYITAVNGGACIEPLANGNCVQKFFKPDNNQYWAAEYEGDKAEKVCFKHVKTGKYMKASGPAASQQIALGKTPEEKTWWLPRQGRAPGTFWMKAEEYPNAWLANQSASWNENALTFVWPDIAGWSHAMCWYLIPRVGFKAAPIESLEEKEAEKKVLQEAEKMKGENEALKKQLEEMKKQDANSTAAAAEKQKLDQELATAKSEREALEKQLAAVKSSSTKAEELDKENATLKKELEQLKTQEKRESGASKAAQLEKENETLKQQLEKARESGNLASSGADGTTADELDRLRAENAGLKKQIHDSEWATTAPDASAKAVEQGNHNNSARSGGTSNGGDDKSEASTEDLSFSQLQEENENLRAQLIVAKRQACHFHHPKMQVRKMPPVRMTWK